MNSPYQTLFSRWLKWELQLANRCMYVRAAVFLSHWKAAQLRNSYPKNPGKNMVSHVSSNATTLNEPAKKFLFYNRVLEWIPELVKHTKVPITLLIFHHQWNRFVPHTYYSQTWLKKYSYLNWTLHIKSDTVWNRKNLKTLYPWIPRIFWIIKLMDIYKSSWICKL